MINVDETRWPRLGSSSPSAGTVWGVHAPTVSFYRILPGKSTDEGRQVLGGYRGTVVVDGFAVYEVLARDGLGLVLAHCWAHTKRKYEDIAEPSQLFGDGRPHDGLGRVVTLHQTPLRPHLKGDVRFEFKQAFN